MSDDPIERVVKEISDNHNKIIGDWSKAYMAQLYQEGRDIKPGCFTLCEQEFGEYNGRYCKRYWFEPGIPEYEHGTEPPALIVDKETKKEIIGWFMDQSSLKAFDMGEVTRNEFLEVIRKHLNELNIG